MTVTGRSRTNHVLTVAGASLGVTALALLAAALTQSPVGALNEGVEAASAASSGALGRLASWLPFGFAFGAGMVSAVNPCGFAMLPAYLGLYLHGDSGEGTIGTRLGRALKVGAAVTAGFVLLFGVAGAAIGAGSRGLADAFPWLGFATGVALIVFGAHLALGGAAYARLGERLAHGVGGLERGGLRGTFAFGLAYGLASLSCTLPIFLAVIGAGLTLDTLGQTGAQLVLYGLGMGVVITALTVALAAFRHTVLDRAKRAVRYVGPIAAGAMLLAGAYIVYYWFTIGGLDLPV